MKTLQRASIPYDIQSLNTTTQTLISRIDSIGGDSTTPLHTYFKNSGIWANETKLAAFRKYSECFVAMDEYTQYAATTPGYQIKFADTATGKPDVQANSPFGQTNYEVKHVDGLTDQLSRNINGAMQQLWETNPVGDNYAVIFISASHFVNWMGKVALSDSLWDGAWKLINQVITKILSKKYTNYHIKVYYQNAIRGTFSGRIQRRV